MHIKRVLLLIVSMFLHVSMGATNQENRKISEENLLASLIKYGGINHDQAELIWLNCGIELINAKEAVEDLEFYVQLDKYKGNRERVSNGRPSTKEETQKTVNILHPFVKQTLLDCLRKKDLMFLVSGEESVSKAWYSRCLDFLFARPCAPKRGDLIQNFGEVPDPSPIIASHSPKPSSPKAAKSPRNADPPVQPFYPRKLSDTTTVKHSKTNLSSTLKAQSKKKSGKNKKSSAVPVAVPAAAALVLVALLSICCCKICGGGSGKGQTDERPLLSLSMSDHSVGSSQKSFSLDSSLSNSKSGNHSFNNTNDKMDLNLLVEPKPLNNSNMEISVGNDSTPVTVIEDSAPLKPPPGIAGMPPLKPPPGRAVLPPPPGKTAPPAPAPAPTQTQTQTQTPPPPPPPNAASPTAPPAPPPLIPSSGGPRPPAPGPGPPPPPIPSGPRPPPPPVGAGRGVPPPRPPGPRGGPLIGFRPPAAPFGPNYEDDSNKAKLKPFFWDKVLANPDNTMVWHQIRGGSFQFNEEMIETLFGCAPQDKNKSGSKKDSADATPQYIQIIDQKKAQNLSILLKALNVTTEEVCDALKEGNELPAELLQTLLKMAPTSDEELKLRLYTGELSQLGFAERFLKVLVEIPFAYKRLDTLHFMCTLQEEAAMVKESFLTLEAACGKLRKSRLFLKLLEAVLKTGNRMNSGTYRGGAQAFKLDTLLKLSDVKGKDGKTTLLHFVVQEIIRLEGLRAARAARELRSISSIRSDDLVLDSPQDSEDHILDLGLEVVSALGTELEQVKRAALIDSDNLTGTVARLGHGVLNAKNFLNSELKSVNEDDGFRDTLENFMQSAEAEVMLMLEQEKHIMALVKSTGDYFHGNAGKDEGLRLFSIVRDFMIMLDKVCTEIRAAHLKKKKENPITTAPSEPPKSTQSASTSFEPLQSTQPASTSSAPVQTTQPSTSSEPVQTTQPVSAPSEPVQPPLPIPRQMLHPAIPERRVDSSSSSSDEE